MNLLTIAGLVANVVLMARIYLKGIGFGDNPAQTVVGRLRPVSTTEEKRHGC